ncbi:MAG: Zn-ribbon domain-containing OB-fold protein [Myxococcales bacterium]|nr:Zn-ribbon domain-containing OB-fold protein [Myxococcales bacterium]MCH7869699.1 Zn-ribbon domain-containing OB-fold protein [Myxococcales bacterium]
MSEQASEPVRLIVTPVRCEYDYTPGAATQKFLRGMQKGKIMGQACDGCGKVYVPPRGACARCGKPTSREVEVKDTGTVVSFSIVRVPSQHIKVDLPYVAANIVLDGADISFSSLIQECPYQEVRIGMRVQGVWKPESEWGPTMANISYFRPLDEPDVPFSKIKEIS